MLSKSSSEQMPRANWQSLLRQNSSGDIVLRFYYYDATESHPTPGKVYLFGKIYDPLKNTHVSSCVVVPVERRLHLLPRKNFNTANSNSLLHVYTEFCKDAAIWRIENIRMKLVRKKYAFYLKNIPEEADYYEVRYPGCYNQIPNNYSNSSIECVIGTSATALEILFTERNMEGPCWLEIKNPELLEGSQTTETWCHYQVNCNNINNITVIQDENCEKLEIPRLISTTLNMTTAVTLYGNSLEIVILHMITDRELNISRASNSSRAVDECCFITTPSKYVNCPKLSDEHLRKSKCDNVIVCENERDLLVKFLEKFQSEDPDILIGFECESPLMNLFERLLKLGLGSSSKINRIKIPLSSISKVANAKRSILQQLFSRPICDVKLAIDDIKPKMHRLHLDGVCSKILNTPLGSIRHINPNRIIPCYSNPAKIFQLVDESRNETLCMMKLAYEMNIIPLSIEITKIAGYALSKTLGFKKIERNEFLLLHAFYKDGFIIPDKQAHQKVSYEGALVLDSIPGVYEDLVLLMDFKSLYPSIIQEYNLCFTTIKGVGYKSLENIELPSKDVKQGIIPRVMGRLVDSRRQAKIKINDPNASPEIKEQCEIKQVALKLLSNTVYGCMGAPFFRFYSANIAATITAKGRGILMATRNIVLSNNLKVLYGDTDSLMINTKDKELNNANKIANKLMMIVNSQYTYIELELEAIFGKLFLANKKNYTGMFFKDLNDDKSELTLMAKGTLPGENQYCQMVRSAIYFVMEKILSNEPFDKSLDKIREYFNEIGDKVKKNEWKKLRPSLVITKELMKEPIDSPNNPADLSLACRINATTKREKDKLRKGDLISFIICNDNTNKCLEERGYLAIEEAYQPDMDFYLFQMLIPELKKSFKAIPQLNDDFFVGCLGLEERYKTFKIKKYQTQRRVDIETFVFPCIKCKSEIRVRGFSRRVNGKFIPVLSSCINPHCHCPPWSYVDTIKANLLKVLKNFKSKFKRAVQITCSNNNCTHVSGNIEIKSSTNCPKCFKEKSIFRETTAPLLYGQMEYLRECFDVESQRDDIKEQLDSGPVEMILAYDELWELVNFFMLRMPMRFY